MSSPTVPAVDTLQACMRALAAGSGAPELTAALAAMHAGGIGEQLALEFGGRSVVAWRPDGPSARESTGDAGTGAAGKRAAREGAAGVSKHPIAVGETRLGTLTVWQRAPLAAEAQGLVRAFCDLLALTLARDGRLAELEGEVGARVREIAQQRAFIECVVDSLPVGLYVVDREYRIHAWNRRRETGLQGIARTDAIGRTIFEVLSRQPAAMLKGEFDEAFTTGRLQQFVMESSASGELRTFRISKIPMRLGGGDVTHVITIGEDITEWKAAIDRTAQSEKLAALGQLAAGVMHEINNPLATIAACAESMAMQAETSDGTHATLGANAGELLRIIDLEVQRCTRIVNGLLDFSRPKPSARQPLELNALVKHGLFLLQHHPKYRRVRMVTQLDERAPLHVAGDSDQLVQTLMALVINAMDAAPEGSRITVSTRQDNAMSVLEVADEGPGISRPLQSKIFEPFFTTKPPGEGTGLGLSICYGIVSDHGGQLELVPSELGATFRVSLPASGTALFASGLEHDALYGTEDGAGSSSGATAGATADAS